MKWWMDINSAYLICTVLAFLFGKIQIIRYIHGTVTKAKTKVILTVIAVILSPLAGSIALFLGADPAYIWFWAIFGMILDIQTIRWVRVLTEPLEALDDIVYDPTITSI